METAKAQGHSQRAVYKLQNPWEECPASLSHVNSRGHWLSGCFPLVGIQSHQIRVQSQLNKAFGSRATDATRVPAHM
jgi:hypothetical protein